MNTEYFFSISSADDDMYDRPFLELEPCVAQPHRVQSMICTSSIINIVSMYGTGNDPVDLECRGPNEGGVFSGTCSLYLVESMTEYLHPACLSARLLCTYRYCGCIPWLFLL